MEEKIRWNSLNFMFKRLVDNKLRRPWRKKESPTRDEKFTKVYPECE